MTGFELGDTDAVELRVGTHAAMLTDPASESAWLTTDAVVNVGDHA